MSSDEMHILTTNKNVRALLPASLIVLLWSAPPHAGTLTPSLQATLAARASADEIAVIIVLADQINISVSARQDRPRRDPMLVKVFKEKADLTQKSLKLFLKNQGAQRIRPLWVTNGIAARVRADVIPRLAAQPGIAIIQLDQSLLAPKVMLASSAPPEWNLDVIEA